MMFLLWSNKHGMWWAPRARGYTPDVDAAGLYTEAEAVGYVVKSAFHGTVDKVTCMVVAPWATTRDAVHDRIGGSGVPS